MKQGNSSMLIPGAVAAALLIIGVALYFAFAGNNEDTANSSAVRDAGESADIRPVSEDDFILGNPEASVIMVEYSDFECPYCGTFHNTMKQIMEEYGPDGKVAWVFRHFPLEQLHPKAPTEALATECAAAQGGNDAFWDMADLIFANTPGNNQLDLGKLPVFAEQIGLNRGEFEACLTDTSSNGLMKNVAEDFQDAVNAGGQGTPFTHLVFQDKVYPLGGALPYTAIKASIDLLLRNEGAAGNTLQPPTMEE